MDQSLFVKNALKLDDSFRFHCNQCGQCCRNREDILLSPYDLNRIANALSVPSKTVIDHYCRLYVGENSRLPVVTIEPLGKERICPFLTGREIILAFSSAAATTRKPTLFISCKAMDAHSRELFKQTYGGQSRLMGSDIMRITYSRVTLYDEGQAAGGRQHHQPENERSVFDGRMRNATFQIGWIFDPNILFPQISCHGYVFLAENRFKMPNVKRCGMCQTFGILNEYKKSERLCVRTGAGNRT